MDWAVWGWIQSWVLWWGPGAVVCVSQASVRWGCPQCIIQTGKSWSRCWSWGASAQHQGLHWGDLWQGEWQVTLSPRPVAHPWVLRSLLLWEGQKRAKVVQGQSIPQLPRGMEPPTALRRSWHQELPWETLSDALYTHRDLLPPLLCHTNPWVPLPHLTVSFRGPCVACLCSLPIYSEPPAPCREQ